LFTIFIIVGAKNQHVLKRFVTNNGQLCSGRRKRNSRI